MSNNNAYVRFSGVQKSYDGEILVVRNLNLDIEEIPMAAMFSGTLRIADRGVSRNSP